MNTRSGRRKTWSRTSLSCARSARNSRTRECLSRPRAWGGRARPRWCARGRTGRRLRTVCSRAHHLGLARPPQALGRDKHSRVLEFLAERAHESDVLLQVFLRPLRVFIPICPRARHHQNKSHILFSPLIPFRASHSATTGASGVPHRSTKTLALDNSRTHALRSARSSAFHRVPALLKFAPL